MQKFKVFPKFGRLAGTVWVLFIIAGSFLSGGCCTQYTNLAQYKAELRHYHDSQYGPDINRQIKKAENYLQTRVHAGETNLALILDIDETSLSNWQNIAGTNRDAMDFGFNAAQFENWQQKGAATAIVPTLRLFNEAQQTHVNVFFVTGRPDRLQAITETNLLRAGYAGWTGIFLRPQNGPPTVTAYKSGVRRQISNQGYVIILNIGDQWSDLNGGYAEKMIKLPNPFYFIP